MSKPAKPVKPVAPGPKLNQILAALPPAQCQCLLPDLELVEMPLGWTMSESGDHVRYLHCPVSGIVSLIYALEDGSSSEIALMGNEDLVGISIYMGGDSMPSSTEVQSAGQAYRLSRKVMKHEFEQGGKLQNLALLYTQALICQTSQMAVCNQHHSVEQQFSRWLLMSFDRLYSSKMQKDGLITKARGSITMVNRTRLEAQACECYAAAKEECERLLPPSRAKH
ncbi:Crp/Fnr family transcriptional regulator [Rhodoferax antarcticus]|uniref:Putative transcriptional regulator, Crp/Fnr family n=1 Tax=Rhodoferax antarcticus ANT.BR TaxID=1111071 RepID=A0A1Q8YGQ3_9BURK|nr:Crp/Fnr family transcriptional regulator [Rhodoferax antarcticus]APW45359.1 Crp/Fnr family transcriptional regulator [Rhodoferax antarcticus]MCW2311191.1 CRP-like cAMP-binding protein [Rhodoferax antarcticus]OLP07241.1 putative transcriptional regulator, Crp/Fnr family [Rhodoferax antarcticus ANT.BR]